MSDEVPVVGAVDESAATNEAPVRFVHVRARKRSLHRSMCQAVDDTVHLSNEERLRILKLDDGTEAQKADHLEAVRVELAKRRRRELTQNTTEELRVRLDSSVACVPHSQSVVTPTCALLVADASQAECEPHRHPGAAAACAPAGDHRCRAHQHLDGVRPKTNGAVPRLRASDAQGRSVHMITKPVGPCLQILRD
jgi:hypothetical protein